MKKHEITPALEALKAVKVNKIGDDKFKKALIADYVTLVKEKKNLEDEIAAIKTTHLSPFEKEQEEIAQLQQELQTETERTKQVEIAREINSHKDYFEAFRAFNKAVEELGKEEIHLGGLDQVKFIDEMDKQGFELGLIEAVFPMFN